MKLSLLKKFLDSQITDKKFLKIVFSEIKEFRDTHEITGTSIKIELLIDDTLDFTDKHLLKLCDSYLNERLSEWHIYYIAEALLMSEAVSFQNNQLEEYVEYISDPDINGPVDTDRMMYIKGNLIYK